MPASGAGKRSPAAAKSFFSPLSAAMKVATEMTDFASVFNNEFWSELSMKPNVFSSKDDEALPVIASPWAAFRENEGVCWWVTTGDWILASTNLN
eukprot:CAMPEP_0194563976 /NCGR_PEP_ID=MMETSP0292-20121207/3817_1 /TAXON_ID=39354 /ORGANISM="Heterosigma akashiwo, Strain CCMP2393" /LENGTH=94 /DNA_ID=CAMNT_0039413015 /DNA_START=13 /DNA_END=297 /DNA_ORIENTATION=+